MQRPFVDIRNVLCTSKIVLDVNKRLQKCYIRSVLLCECKSWTISKNIENWLAAVRMWFWILWVKR